MKKSKIRTDAISIINSNAKINDYVKTIAELSLQERSLKSFRQYRKKILSVVSQIQQEINKELSKIPELQGMKVNFFDFEEFDFPVTGVCVFYEIKGETSNNFNPFYDYENFSVETENRILRQDIRNDIMSIQNFFNLMQNPFVKQNKDWYESQIIELRGDAAMRFFLFLKSKYEEMKKKIEKHYANSVSNIKKNYSKTTEWFFEMETIDNLLKETNKFLELFFTNQISSCYVSIQGIKEDALRQAYQNVFFAKQQLRKVKLSDLILQDPKFKDGNYRVLEHLDTNNMPLNFIDEALDELIKIVSMDRKELIEKTQNLISEEVG